MVVSDRDKERMRRLGEDLDATKNFDRGTPEQRAGLLKVVNDLRRRAGLDPVEDEPYPEEGLYERARALGMARTDRGRS